MIHNFVSLAFFKTLLWGRGSLGFVIGIIFCFAFSIAVVLSTSGLMDGFEYTLKSALKFSGGDLSIHSKRGFFELDQDLKKTFDDMGFSYAPLIRTEGFMIRDDFSKGVLVQGIEGDSFSLTSGLGIDSQEGEIVVGKELADLEGLQIGDEVFLALMTRKKKFGALPDTYRFRVKKIVSHNIYNKDMRMVYINLSQLQSILNLGTKFNFLILNKFSLGEKNLIEKINSATSELQAKIDPLFIILPFWKEFSTLIEAIEVEKLILTLILQLLVVVAIFNILAFVIFMEHYRAKEIFLFQALGVSKKNMTRSWLLLLFLVWLCSCLLAVFFTSFFNWVMFNMNLFELPGKIYNLVNIETRLSWSSYAIAFSLSLFWLLGIFTLSFKRMQKKSLLSSVRLEFGS